MQLAFRRPWRGGLIALAVVAAVASGCSSSKEVVKDAFAEDLPAGTLYNQGLANLSSGKLKEAVDRFNEVDRQHPYSEYAQKALLMSAFANYRRSDFTATVDAAE